MTPQDQPVKRCKICKAQKPPTPEFFYANHKSKDGLSPYCRVCHLDRNKANYRKAKAIKQEVRARLALLEGRAA